MIHQMSFEEGFSRKLEGQKRVTDKEPEQWVNEAMGCLSYIARTHDEFSFADVREMATHHFNLPNPHHPNVWGALMSKGAAKGWIEKTDRYVQSPIPSAHARMIRVWKSKIYQGC